MGRFFGTDGFRGEAGSVLTAEHAYKVGRYLGWYHASKIKDQGQNSGSRSRIVIGEDTRRSSGMLENALAAGITASGADAYLMHVTTTPSVSYITKSMGFDCGVMISASHNPYYDNGLKVINGDGSKLSDDQIAEIEAYLLGDTDKLPYALREDIGAIYDYEDGVKAYKQHIIGIAEADGVDLKGKKIALDLANGAASGIAGDIFKKLGAEVYVIGDRPDGFNINDKVGSTHTEALCETVKKYGCDIGFAYDGDADRCLASDEKGTEINGDQIIYACARYMKDRGLLWKNTAAVTVMSNYGTFKAFENAGIGYETTAVGDRFVWECMEKNGYALGGEQSGHIIFAKDASTGDGILTSVKVMGVLLGSKAGKASELFAECSMYPQVLKNVRVSDKDAVLNNENVKAAVKKAEEELNGTGRVLLRKSGTEPVIRVMAEAGATDECGRICDNIISVMKEEGLA